MKYFILIIVLLSKATFTFSQKFNYPKIKLLANSLHGFVPKGWIVLDSAFGDLNNDKINDVAFILQHKDSVTIIEAKNGEYWYDADATYNNKLYVADEYGYGTIVAQPRILIIAFKDKNSSKFILKEQSNTFIPIHDNPMAMDPCEPGSLKISKGVLTLSFGNWMSAGSWEASNHSYSFRYQANEFALIGATSSFMHRATGEYTDCSYNFLTKKRECISGNIENDKPTTKPEWTKFYLKNLPTLKTFKKPYTLKVGNSIL